MSRPTAASIAKERRAKAKKNGLCIRCFVRPVAPRIRKAPNGKGGKLTTTCRECMTAISALRAARAA